MKTIYVIDLETTGLKSYPADLPIEISIYKITPDLEVKHSYTTLIRYHQDLEDKINGSWWAEQSGVTWEDTKESPTLREVWNRLRMILKNQYVTSWNVSFDFNRMLIPMSKRFGPLDFKLLQCPMLVATNIVKAEWNEYYSSWKWPSLEEAASYYDVSVDPNGYGFHRAGYDANVTSEVLVEMIRRKQYAG